MKGSSTLLGVVVLAACASAAPATPLAPSPDAAATTPAPAPSPAAGPSTNEASTLAGEAAPAPAPEPMPRLETGPDRYQVPSVFMDDSSGVLIVDLAAGTGTGLARKAQRGKTPARWVTRRAKEAVVVEVERIDLPLPAGVEQKPTWGPKNPDAPQSTDVLLGEGWVERAIVLRGKRYRVEQGRVMATDPATGNKRPLELPGFEVTHVFVAGDELALLGIEDERDVLAMLDVAAGTLTRKIPLPPSMDQVCAKSELRFLGELVVLAEQDRAYVGILCHHGQD